MSSSSSSNTEVKETIDILYEMSSILDTKLDKDTLALCISLCEKGVNPEALAEVLKNLQKENASTKRNSSRPV
ncbi:mitotic-spindle organizing protein 1 [Chlamydoabsidia padenii]|nr:mitotic-spindle organizing protein 1 [Chlamydoabsidia padenii]